jgi:hypothetical protein
MKYVILVVAIVVSVIAYAQTSSKPNAEIECEKFVNAYIKGLEVGEVAGGNSKKLALNKSDILALKEKMEACELKKEIIHKNHQAQ